MHHVAQVGFVAADFHPCEIPPLSEASHLTWLWRMLRPPQQTEWKMTDGAGLLFKR